MPSALTARPRVLPASTGGAHARRAAVALLAGAAFAVGPTLLPLDGAGAEALHGLGTPAAHAAPLLGAPAPAAPGSTAAASSLLITEIAPTPWAMTSSSSSRSRTSPAPW